MFESHPGSEGGAVNCPPQVQSPLVIITWTFPVVAACRQLLGFLTSLLSVKLGVVPRVCVRVAHTLPH